MSKQVKKVLEPELRFPEFRDAGEWEDKPLGEILNYKQPTRYLVENTKYNDNYETPVLTAGKTFLLGYTNETKGIFKNNLPTIIFDDFTTAFQFVDFPFKAKSSAMKMLIPATSETNMKFAFEAMKTVKFFPSTHKRYWISEYQNIEVPFPSPAEQQKIADCLSSLDELITAHNQKHETLKAHKKGMMQQLFPSEGETVPKLRFPEFRDAGEWNIEILDELFYIIDGDRGKNYPKADEFSDNEYCVFLNAKNVTKNGFKFDVVQFVTQEKDKLLRKGKLKRSDVILTTRGSVGHFAFYSKNVSYDNIRINSGMVILREKTDEITPDYLYAFSKSEIVSRTIEDNAFGNAQQQLTVSGIKKFKIYYPKPREQKKIVGYLSNIDDLIIAQAQKIETLKSHKKGMMQQLFPATDEVET